MKRISIFCVFLLILLSCQAMADDWAILQQGWWNSSAAAITDARNQIQDTLLLRNGQTTSANYSVAQTAEDWQVLAPGWWNASDADLSAAETQLTNQLKVLSGELVVIGQNSVGTVNNTYNPYAGGEVLDGNAAYGPYDQVSASNAYTGQPVYGVSTSIPGNIGTQASVPVMTTPQPVQPVTGTGMAGGFTAEDNSPVLNISPYNAEAIVITSTNEANVRSTPDTDYGTIYGREAPGTVLECLGYVDGWYKVRLKDGVTVGYISGRLAKPADPQYIQRTSGLIPPSPSPTAEPNEG